MTDNNTLLPVNRQRTRCCSCHQTNVIVQILCYRSVYKVTRSQSFLDSYAVQRMPEARPNMPRICGFPDKPTSCYHSRTCSIKARQLLQVKRQVWGKLSRDGPSHHGRDCGAASGPSRRQGRETRRRLAACWDRKHSAEHSEKLQPLGAHRWELFPQGAWADGTRTSTSIVSSRNTVPAWAPLEGPTDLLCSFSRFIPWCRCEACLGRH